MRWVGWGAWAREGTHPMRWVQVGVLGPERAGPLAAAVEEEHDCPGPQGSAMTSQEGKG